MNAASVHRSRLTLPMLGALLLVMSPLVHADADDTTDHARSLDPVLVTAQRLQGPQLAPSQGSLVATQPQSIVGGDFIQLNDAPAVNYTDIIKFTPSVWSVDPNGPGLMENQVLSIRGFQDGQFNVTFDGIPWGDSNDFTHHSTSYFMSQDIGNVIVDRGPGSAATLGDATFGGTVYVQSADPKREMGLTTTLSFGSFNTHVEGVRYDTGEISEWGGTRAFISLKTMGSDGYLTNANLSRSNAFVKVIQPINDSTDITFASNLNKLLQNPPVGATPNQMAAYGSNYGYNSDPGSQGYFGYNLDRISTDYEYLGLNSKFSGWTFDNKLYTYAYYHDGYNGEDTGGSLPNGGIDVGDIPNGTYNPDGSLNANDVPGQRLTNNYRSVGDIFRLSRELGPGSLQAGAWYDHQTNLRALYEVDMSDNQAFNYDNPFGPLAPGASPLLAYTDRLMDDQLFTKQIYLQYVWHVVNDLDITGGVKHVSFERDLNAPVNQKTGLEVNEYDVTWTRNLSSLDAHYKLTDNWSAYAQWAQGFLAPNLNLLYTNVPNGSTLQPEATTNYQAGTTWVGQAGSVSLDGYYIDFNNLLQKHLATVGLNNDQAFFYNSGGVIYKGVEAEGTLVIGAGFSLYANASINSARLKSDDTWVPLTPNETGVIGLLFKQGPLQASLIDKYVGVRYGDAEDYYRFGGYSTVDASFNYLIGQWAALKAAKIGVTVQNLTNNKSLYVLDGYSGSSSTAFGANGVPLLFTLPGISVEVNLSASF